MAELDDFVPNEPDDPDGMKKDTKEIRSSFEVIRSMTPVYVVVLAVHKDRSLNAATHISCRSGIPIGGYIHDAVNDRYLVYCYNYLTLGIVPVSFKLKLAECADWEQTIPVPEKVLKRYMTQQQRADLRRFTESNKSTCTLQFIQMMAE